MIEVRVLGPVEVSTDHGVAQLRPREAAVVAALALSEQPRLAADLVHLIWEDPPPTAVEAVRNHVSQLRRAAKPLVATGVGYRFEADVHVDARRLEVVAAAAAGGDLGGSAVAQIGVLGAARGLWRGDPFPELVAHPHVIVAREHLADLCAVIDEERAAAMLDAHQNIRARVLLERLVRDAPRRSRRWSLLALASYRCGLRGAALAASARANDFRTDADADADAGSAVDEQLVWIYRDDPILLTVPARRTTRRTMPIIGPPVDTRLRRPGFVGRSGELARLARLVDAGTARDAPIGSRIALVEGEPGIGKTGLVYRAATAASERGVLALWSWCDTTPIGPFPVLTRLVHDLVAALGGDVVRDLAGSDLPALLTFAPDAAWGDERTGAGASSGPAPNEAAIRVLEAAARMRPVVCVVDDVQWASPSTVRVIADLTAAEGPLMLVLVARSGQLPPDLAVPLSMKVVLDKLEIADVEEYLNGALEFTPGPELVDLIWSRTGGHPLFLREVVESIEPAASAEAAFALATGPDFPRSVADAVARRLSDLSTPTLRAVRAASVLGASFSPALLADMVDLDDAALAEATAAGIITPEARRGRARFCHELVRSAIYGGLAELTRAEFHESAGIALTKRGVLRWNEVARHFVAAAALDPQRAVVACRRAGEDALASFAYDDAAEHHRCEVELLDRMSEPDPPALVDALVACGFAMLRCGDPEMVDVLTRAAVIERDNDDSERLARAMTVLCGLSPTSEAGAPTTALVELLDFALERAQNPDTLARLAASASYLYSMSGDWERCRSLYDRAVSTGASSRAMAEVLPLASAALGGPDDLGHRAAAADALDLIGEQDRDPVARAEALHLRIGVQLQKGDPRFRETLDQMIEMESIVTEPKTRWAIAYLTATREHIDGHLIAAEEAAADALGPRCRGIAESRRVAAYAAQIVALRADDDRLVELVAMLERLVDDQPDVAGWRAVLVGVLGEGVDRPAAQVARAGHEFDGLAADGFAALPRDFTWTASMTLLTRGIAATGDARRARIAYDALVPYAGRMSWSGGCTFGPVDQVLGEAAVAFDDGDRALSHFGRAVLVAERLRAPRMVARARAGLEARLPGRGADGIVD